MIFQNPFENRIHSKAPIKVKCRVKTRGLLHPCVVLEADESTQFIVEGCDFEGKEICLGDAHFFIGDSPPVHLWAFVVQAISMLDPQFFYKLQYNWEGYTFEALLIPRIERMKALGQRSLFSGHLSFLGVSLILPSNATSSP